jgi:hypothetical protein
MPAVPPAGTAIREMSGTMEESEGHCLSLRPLSLSWNKALPKPNSPSLQVRFRVSISI